MTTATGDVRGFYRALGIEFAGWAQRNASVRCFANPDAHSRGDRNASTSVSVHSGAWRCWGCGARGGAYDAALHLGRSPREAIDLMVAFGLTERRRRHAPRGRRKSAVHVGLGAPTAQPALVPAAAPPPPPPLEVSEDDVAVWARALQRDRLTVARLEAQRAWAPSACAQLQVGLDEARITFPMRDDVGRLVGLWRYRAWDRGDSPKILAAPGSHGELFPAPEGLHTGPITLVEGQPDAVAGRSAGMNVTAIPGVRGWRPAWATRFIGRAVTVCLDCDTEGRESAARIAADLRLAGVAVRVLDLAPRREDGYDLTDELLADSAPQDLVG